MSLMGLALLAAASSAPTISTAVGDWSNIPLVAKLNNAEGMTYVADALENAARSKECSLPGVSRERVELKIPFLIRFDTSGAVTEVVVQKIGCPSVETAMGNAILRLAERGEYRPTGVNLTGWYRGAYDIVSYNIPHSN